MIETQVNRHQRRVFKALLLITALGGLMFFLLNFSRGLHLLASIELIAGGISLLLFFQVYRNLSVAKFRQLTMTYVLIFYAIMMFAFTRERISNNIFVWVQVIPLLSYLLLGLKRGFFMTLGFVVLFTLCFFVILDTPKQLQNLVSVANVALGTLLTWGLSHAYEKATETSQKKLRKLAITDHLTGLYNRSLLKASFAAAKEQTQFERKHLALVVLDLDYFKSINDTHGHDVGDFVLKTFSGIIQDEINEQSYAFRMGGEEFCIICPNTTMDQATKLANSIRANAEEQKLETNDSLLGFSVSCGVSSSDDENTTFKALHTEADRRLYLAKSSGRNKVVNQD